MNEKLLFFDIDGTLIDENGKIPESTMKALHMAKEQGHLLFVNTGRTKSFLPEELLQFPFDGYLCGCGTHIIYHNEDLTRTTLSLEECHDIIRHLKIFHAQGVLEGIESCYYDDTIEVYDSIKEMLGPLGLASAFRPYSKYADRTFSKFCIMYGEDSDKEACISYCSEKFDYIDRGGNFAEVLPKGASKASAIDHLLAHLGKSLKNCYVFGDSTNDLSMLTHVKNSIGMGNSDQPVLDVVSYVTTPIWKDGIYLALKHFDLI